MKPFHASDVIDYLADVSKGNTTPLNVPEITFTCPNLAATSPEPHKALDPEYLRDNEITPDIEYILTLAFQAGVENGWRLAN